MVCNCEIIHGHIVCSCSSQIHVGEQVETINGIGTVEEVRDHRSVGGEITFLICTGRGGFGGTRDVYSRDEVWKLGVTR